MKKVKVTASKSYEIFIGENLISSLGETIREISKASKIAIVTDDNVDPIYGAMAQESLEMSGFLVSKIVLANGEQSKNGENLINILNFFARQQITRTDLALALGGGVIGDIAGFAAAVYLRGIEYVQVPTTLLAQVDSSVGGKTAIDLEAGKNLAGAFWQPKRVVCDYLTLKTLNPQVFSDGCAEVIKYGVLGDRLLFDHLMAKGKDFDTQYVISRCVEMKRDLVEMDERDTGERRLLNLGHTLGHAVEKCSGYGVSHGAAVAIGMTVVSKAAALQGFCSLQMAEDIEKILTKFDLPTHTSFRLDELIGAMAQDKKREGTEISVIVPLEIGKCEIVPMGMDRLKIFMKAGLEA